MENAEVGKDDIVMTVDVNLFVMTPDIVKPILSHPDMTAWVPQYHDTVSARKGWGETFNQNLIAMRAKTWQNITGLSFQYIFANNFSVLWGMMADEEVQGTGAT